MQRERQKGVSYSSALHVIAIILLLAGLPNLLDDDHEVIPAAVTVEIVPISELSNIKPAETPPAPEQKPEKLPEAQKPSPPVKTAETPPPPPPPPEEKEKKPEKKPEPKVVEKKPEEKKPEKKMKEEDLLAVLKSVKETAAKQEKKVSKAAEDSAPSKSKSNNYDPNLKLSLSESDAIANQVSRNWSPPVGARNAHDLKISIIITMDSQCNIMNVTLGDSARSRAAGDSFFRAAADSAVRAVKITRQITGLPEDRCTKFGGGVELYFDPSEMLL